MTEGLTPKGIRNFETEAFSLGVKLFAFHDYPFS